MPKIVHLPWIYEREFSDNICFSLEYCELDVTLGTCTLFRRFGNVESNHSSEEDLAYDDYGSAQTPLAAPKFHVTERI
jgi:hypothetical protein